MDDNLNYPNSDNPFVGMTITHQNEITHSRRTLSDINWQFYQSVNEDKMRGDHGKTWMSTCHYQFASIYNHW